MKRFICILVCAVSVFCGLSAREWTAAESSAERSGMLTVLSGPQGRTARIVSPSALTAEDAVLLGNCLNAVWALPGLEGTEASVRIDGNGFKLVVYPASFEYNGTDFALYLPAGLGFYYRDTLFYDITLKVDGYMPKVSGAYVSPEGLLKNMYAAVLVPQMYVYDAGLLERLEHLESAVMALTKKGFLSKPSSVSSGVVLAVIGLHNENPEITAAEAAAALKAQGMKADIKDINAVFFVLLGVIP